jgi:hypothetical protein
MKADHTSEAREADSQDDAITEAFEFVTFTHGGFQINDSTAIEALIAEGRMTSKSFVEAVMRELDDS